MQTTGVQLQRHQRSPSLAAAAADLLLDRANTAVVPPPLTITVDLVLATAAAVITPLAPILVPTDLGRASTAAVPALTATFADLALGVAARVRGAGRSTRTRRVRHRRFQPGVHRQPQAGVTARGKRGRGRRGKSRDRAISRPTTIT